MAKTANRGAVDRMRETHINPIPVVAVSVIIAGGLAYFFWLKPSMEESKIKKEWTNPEQAALRAPGGKPVDQSHEAFLADLRQKNGRTGAKHERRRDSD